MIDHRVYVGTIGEGLFRSLDGGRTFRRACEGMFVECDVRALAVHPRHDEVLYLGTELGLFVSTNGADSWERLPAPLDGLQVWSILVDPQRPERLLVGTCPSRLFHSADGGKNWTEASADLRRDCPRILHTRVTCLARAEDDSDLSWAGVEIDGVHRSRDGGRSWTRVGQGLSSQDIHALVVIPLSGGRRRLLATTNNDLNYSDDDGDTWTPLRIDDQVTQNYCRGLTLLIGRPPVALLGLGDGPPGSCGAIARSEDGLTWQRVLAESANSTLWNFATHPSDPKFVYASSVSGEVYRSTDGGHNWQRLPREFGEIRALAWTP